MVLLSNSYSLILSPQSEQKRLTSSPALPRKLLTALTLTLFFLPLEPADREAALSSLRNYLSSHRSTPFSPLDLLKLWKGLFYCMWMADKPLPQQRLAVDLAGLVDILPEESVLPWLDTFWKTMAREWRGIDVLRMNKFLLLVRVYLGAGFRWCGSNGWKDTSRVERYLDILRETPLNARDDKIPNGMRYHVVDIYVDELDKVDEEREGKMPLEKLLDPLGRLGKESPTKAVRERVKEALEDERLINWQERSGKDEDEGQDEDEMMDNAKVLKAQKTSDGYSGAARVEDEDDEWEGFDD